jgi:hypothetical protein
VDQFPPVELDRSAVARWSHVSTLISVLLPAPFSPIKHALLTSDDEIHLLQGLDAGRISERESQAAAFPDCSWKERSCIQDENPRLE